MALAEQWGRLHRELGDNPRLRLGLWAIGLILAGYVVLVVSDYRTAEGKRLEQAATEYERLASLSGDDTWAERRQAAVALRVQAEEMFWHAEGHGLAQASVESWLRDQIGRMGIDEVNVTMEEVAAVPDLDLLRVSARVNGRAAFEQVAQLLFAVESYGQFTAVDQLEFDRTRDGRFLMRLSAYFSGLAPEAVP